MSALVEILSTSGADTASSTMGARIYAALCDRLIGGELPPGEKVSLRTIADELGTSVTPVREAVARLVADGALTVLPSRAISVPVMTVGAFRELTEVRVAIEGFAAERAAVHRRPADLEAIRRHDAAFRAECTSARPDPAAAMRANRDLHFAIYAAAGLPSLVKIIAGLWLKVGPLLNYDLRLSPQRLGLGGAETCHAQCLRAIAAQDAAAARAALTDDIRRAASFIEAMGELPP